MKIDQINRVGVGVIGLGLAIKPHAVALRELSNKIDFVAGFSRSEARRAEFYRNYAMPVASSMDVILSDPRVRVVMILTPPRTHTELAERALRAGKHVLIEKPLEVSLSGAREIVDMADRHHLKLGVVLQHRFRPAVSALRQIISSGELGDIISASATIRWWRGPDYYAQPGRGMQTRDGGGVLLTQAIHTLDALLNLVGPAVEVTASCVNSGLRVIDTEDVACATVHYQCGAVGVIDATTVAFPGYPERIEIAGTGGSAVLIAEALVVHRTAKATLQIEGSQHGGGGVDPMAFSHEPHRALIEDFVDSIVTNRESLSSGRSALAVHALIEAMLTSSSAKRAMHISQ